MNKIFRFSSLYIPICLFLGMIVYLLGFSSYAEASRSTFYAKPDGLNSGDCPSWEQACDLQYALGIVESGDQVWVEEGIYYPGTIVTDSFQLKDGVAMYGGFPKDGGDWDQRDWKAYKTILSGDIDQNDLTEGGVVTDTKNIRGTNSYHVVSGIESDHPVLDGFTITAGNAAQEQLPNSSGGGIYIIRGHVILVRVVFSGNMAYEWGGGLYNEGGITTLFNVTITSNEALVGGGVSINNDGTATFSNVSLNNNLAGWVGGGLFNAGDVTLTDVSLSGNQVLDLLGRGGGVFLAIDGHAIFQNVLFSNNSAIDFGGGLHNDGGTGTFTNVTFSGNTSTKGGGLFYDAGDFTFTNVTFFGNSATQNGGGIYNGVGSSGTGSHPIFTNAIFWGNSPNQIYNDEVSSATVTFSDIQGGWDGEGNISVDPQLGPLANNGGFNSTLALGEGSPAIDSGSTITCPLTDQRGLPRPFDGDGDGIARCDMGAYEYGSVYSYRQYLPLVAEIPQQFSCSDVTQIPQAECEALVELYKHTFGDNWTNNTNWLVTNTPSNWYGVTVWDGHVTKIYLYGNQVTGVVPPELKDLIGLNILNLGWNQLTGSIPAELGDLVALVELNLSENQLTGNIPPELGNLVNLETLYLYWNQLTGTIPATLGDLTALKLLNLSWNHLTGTIPPTLGDLTDLVDLSLCSNQLSGEIPPELINLTSLVEITLCTNQLTGAIPASMGDWTNLKYLNLFDNQLIGSIPPELGKLTKLRSLILGDNKLTGTIPSELGYLTDLIDINLGFNQLSGNIPPELGNLVALEWLYLWGNQLSGSIPPELGKLTSITFGLYLNYNQLSGEIPQALGNLTNMQRLQIDNNPLLSGSIPLSFIKLTQLTGFYYDNTNLCEPTDQVYQNWKSTVLDYQGTGITCP